MAMRTRSVRSDAWDRQELLDCRRELAAKVLDDVLGARVEHPRTAVVAESGPERIDVLVDDDESIG